MKLSLPNHSTGLLYTGRAMTRHLIKRVLLLSSLCLMLVQSSQAQERPNLCSQLSTLIESSETGFVSMAGDTMDEKERSYISKLEMSGWTDGFVYPEAADGPYILYVSLGGNNLPAIRQRYRTWIPKLTACLRGWKRTETASAEEVKSVFTQTLEGPVIQLDYNIEPSTVGDTKYDLYLTFKAPLSVVEKNFCADLSNLINSSQTGFASIVGDVEDEKQGSFRSTLKLSAWGTGYVYPQVEDPHVRYIMLGSNRSSEIRRNYSRWVSKLTTCLPGWKRTETTSAEDVESVFSETSDGPSIDLDYNRKPSKVGSTKYDLYLTIQAPRATQKGSP
jgi:preprotein translocase subunit SecB